MLTSFYAPPHLTGRFWPVVMRNLLVWKKLAGPSILGNIAEPLITLVAFGYGVGSLIGQIDGLPYIEYLASGTVALMQPLDGRPVRGSRMWWYRTPSCSKNRS